MGSCECFERSGRNGKDVAAIFSQRVLKQERVFVEQLRLDLFRGERLRLRERRVCGTIGPDQVFQRTIFGIEFADLLFNCLNFLLNVLPVQDRNSMCGFRFDQSVELTAPLQ